MFYAQLKLVVRENGRFLRYENLASSSLEDLNKDVDVRMRDLRPFAYVVEVRYWETDFKWSKLGLGDGVFIKEVLNGPDY